jgi:hypothetical protein
MKNTKKIGALLLGLMFLASTLGAAFAGTANEIPVVPVWHSIDVGPDGTQPVPDAIKLVDSNGNVYKNNQVQNTASTTFWIERESGTTLALSVVAEKSGYQTFSQAFTVDGNSPGQLPGINYKLQSGGGTCTVTLDVPATVSVGDNITAVGTATPAGCSANIRLLAPSTAVVVPADANGQASKVWVSGTDFPAAVGSYSFSACIPNTGCTGTDGQTKTVAVIAKPSVSGDIIVNDFDFDDKVSPGQSVEFDIELKSNASYDAENVEARVIVKDLAADSDDVESETIDFGKLDKGKKETDSVSITVPQDADDKKYSVEVELEWVDEATGKQYSSVYKATDELEVVKPKHQVLITGVQTDKSSYSEGDSLQLEVSIMNTGANDESVQVKLASDFGTSAQSAVFKLKEGDSTTQYLSLAVPEGTDDGNYFVIISALYSGTSDVEKLIVAVTSEDAGDTSVVVVSGAEAAPKGEIPPAGIALGIVALVLAALLIYYGKDLFSNRSAVAVKAKR